MSTQQEPTADLVTTRERSRLAGPGRTSTHIPRERLDERFAAGSGRVVRLLAPAGYGKSSLASRWVQDEVRTVRWLDLEPIDNDPLVLATALENALRGLTDSAPRSLPEMVAGAEPFVLVLDDIHHLRDESSIRLVEATAERLPSTSTLVLAGRAYHGHGIARLRLDPGIIDVSAEDLAFDLGETEEMLTVLGADVELDTVTRLFGLFEGWPAGLRLAALTPEVDGNPPGRSSYVTDFVAAEWLSRLDEHDRELLRGAACLQRFTADMCDTVLERSGSAADMARLAREEAMVVPLDQRDDWFRMHPVLSDSLASELRSFDSERWRQIHLRAARWWAQLGDADLAVEHAVTAGDLDLCEELIFSEGPQYMARGMCTTIQRWFAMLGDVHLLASPDLCLLAAFTAIQTGDGRRAADLISLVPDLVTDREGDVWKRVCVTRGVIARISPAESVALTEDAETAVPLGAWRVSARWSRGTSLFLLGDDRAADQLRSAAAEAELADLVVLHPNVLATLAIVEAIDGRSGESIDLVRRAFDLLGPQHTETMATTAVVSSAAALVDAGAGQSDRSREGMARARRHLRNVEMVAPWFNIIGRLALVRVCLLLEDPEQGSEILGELRRIRHGDARIAVDDHIDALAAELHEVAAANADRPWGLTDAEHRVLHYLPTNLSLADIASRLYVSRNTVKSHAAAIYRKLGATSRGQAVDRAREAGLLADDQPIR